MFLDFEASSLGKHSYPIEVAWVFEDGREEAHLIRPQPDWTDWDDGAAEIHGIARATLDRDGEPVEAVSARMVQTLTGHDLCATAPSWDGHWLSLLLRAGGRHRRDLRLRDSDDVHLETAAALLRPRLSDADLPGAAQALVDRAKATVEAAPPAHRALADARREHALWREVRRLAAAPPGA